MTKIMTAKCAKILMMPSMEMRHQSRFLNPNNNLDHTISTSK